MNKTKIDWPFENLYTWNPIFGCLNNCSYCYARKIAIRFKGNFTPRLDEHILDDKDLAVKKPRSVFVGSMADVFGEWVPSAWIQKVLDKANMYPHHKYIFLTKNPERYLDFKFKPLNVWLGVTRESAQKIKSTDGGVMRVLRNIEGHKTFLSAEPLLGSFHNVVMNCFDLVIVGALSGNRFAPPVTQEEIDSIVHPRIYFKKSIRELGLKTGGRPTIETLPNPLLSPAAGKGEK